jgi:hypothetical protein
MSIMPDAVQLSRLPGFGAEAVLEGRRSSHGSATSLAKTGAGLIRPQSYRRLSRGIRKTARQGPPAIRVLPKIFRSVSRSATLGLYCTAGLCRTVQSQ